MVLAVLNGLFAFAPAPAPGTAPDPKAQMLQMFGTLVFMGLAMYLLLFRPQQKRAREHANLLKTMKAGDVIVTTGGIRGTVISVKEKTITIRSLDSKLEILKSAVGEVVERSATAAES